METIKKIQLEKEVVVFKLKVILNITKLQTHQESVNGGRIS